SYRRHSGAFDRRHKDKECLFGTCRRRYGRYGFYCSCRANKDLSRPKEFRAFARQWLLCPAREKHRVQQCGTGVVTVRCEARILDAGCRWCRYLPIEATARKYGSDICAARGIGLQPLDVTPIEGYISRQSE